MTAPPGTGEEAGPRPAMRVGILGGTFDPVHLGHLVAAQDAFDALALDRLHFVPAGVPPHKSEEEITPASLRLRMVKAAIEDDPRFDALDLELRREGPSYTVDTLRTLHEQDPGAELHLLLGADQWAGFSTWREPRTILELARVVVMTRSGESPSRHGDGDGAGAWEPFAEVSVTRLDITSSDIRVRAREGRSIRYVVPDAVRRIIDAAKLYRGP